MIKKRVASLEFKAEWQSEMAEHTDICFARKVNLWRDILPAQAADLLNNGGEHAQFTLSNGDLLQRDERSVLDLKRECFRSVKLQHHTLRPRFGRFYPRGLLTGVSSVYSSNVQPFRCIEVSASDLRVDFNHPLAGRELDIEISVRNIREKHSEIGGQMTDWLEVLTDGPGMQARCQGRPTNFFGDSPFMRPDECDDAIFYENPRFVTHVDDQALEHIRGIYGKWLQPGARVLDLMSSVESHIPESIQLEELVGLGLNEEELQKNPRLTARVIHDLNRQPVMPFDDNSFDAVICTVSVEYLTNPLEVFRDCARVLKPRGLLIHTFSNRWFPPKVTRIWTELSEFERMGLVLEYYLRSNAFEQLHTFSLRGWPRPVDDQYYPRVKTADPVYAVVGKARAS
jgi:hypothetical protein